MVVRKVNRKKRVKWCKERRGRTVDNHWEKVMFSDESQIVLGTNNRDYIWWKNDKKYNLYLICSRSEQKISLIIWGCILLWRCWNSNCSWRQHQLCQVHWRPRQEVKASSCLVFWTKRILGHGWQCACSQSPHCKNYKDQNEVTSIEWPA